MIKGLKIINKKTWKVVNGSDFYLGSDGLLYLRTEEGYMRRVNDEFIAHLILDADEGFDAFGVDSIPMIKEGLDETR